MLAIARRRVKEEAREVKVCAYGHTVDDQDDDCAECGRLSRSSKLDEG